MSDSVKSISPIGVFDSGFGGLSVLRSLRERLPQYDYLYLGDNARAPYGTRSFETVHRFTLQCVQYLFNQGCPLVILACNTASAKALRNIQQNWLPTSDDPTRRVLGVIRPTAEAVAETDTNGHVGVFATPGTIASSSYDIEIHNLRPDFKVSGHACPMWVPLVEEGYANSPGADFFVREGVDALMAIDPKIDTVLLACTHYPLLYNKIRQYTPANATVVCQGEIVADSLRDYLVRHPEMERRLTRGGTARFLTTESADKFSSLASLFLGHDVAAERVEL